MTLFQLLPPQTGHDRLQVEPADSMPLQQLADAYADRLAALGAGADDVRLAELGERVTALEAVCRSVYAPHRTVVSDTALYLG